MCCRMTIQGDCKKTCSVHKAVKQWLGAAVERSRDSPGCQAPGLLETSELVHYLQRRLHAQWAAARLWLAKPAGSTVRVSTLLSRHAACVATPQLCVISILMARSHLSMVLKV
jgi:hypothetical protein